MSRLTISMPPQMQAIAELRLLMDVVERSGVSRRTLPEVLEVTRAEARQKGLLPEEG